MMGVSDARRRADAFACRTCKHIDGVFWKGADVPCIWCGCSGVQAHRWPDTKGRSGMHTYRAADDMTFWERAA